MSLRFVGLGSGGIGTGAPDINFAIVDMNAAIGNVALGGVSGGSSGPAPAASVTAQTSDTRYARPRPAGSVPARRKR